MEYVTSITLELCDLIALLEINQTNGALGLYCHGLRIELTPLQLIDDGSHLAIIFEVATASRLSSESEINEGHADDEAAEDEDGDCTEEHQYYHKDQPRRCVRIILTIIIITKVDCVSPNCKNGKG